uniref:Uncharacterized protein n=1 Tax=Amphimedon queenslandica TaxID=400682 RepID=A0A1X7VJ55_AMPQE
MLRKTGLWLIFMFLLKQDLSDLHLASDFSVHVCAYMDYTSYHVKGWQNESGKS